MHHCLLLFDPIIKVRFYSVTSVSPDVYGVCSRPLQAVRNGAG